VPAKQLVLGILSMAAIFFLAGCGGSTFNVQNPGGGSQQPITISFASPPPTGISLGGTASLTANVANDSTNAGVDWTVTCVNQNTFSCGTLNSAHTASGDPVTYTPPSAFTGNSDAVSIVAYATASHSANVLAPITITAFGNVLQGTYVFQVRGNDSTFSPAGYPYQLTGEAYFDGSGNITTPSSGTAAGQQTLNTFDVNSTLDSTTTQITGGSYFIGTDGRGLLVIETTDQSGDSIEEDFSLVVSSSAKVSIAQIAGILTNGGGPTDLFQSGTGTLELQDPAAANTLPSAGYAFSAIGTDSSSTPLVYGGIFNIDSPGGISGTGTLTDQAYNGVFTSCSAQHGFAGSTVALSGTPGVVTFDLVTTCSGFAPTQIAGYIVDASHIQLIETDGTFFAAGLAFGQGSSTGTFSSFSGNYIFDALGMDLSSFLPSSLTSVDVISADQAGNLTSGYTDTAFFSNADGDPALVSSQLAGTYQLDNKQVGRVHLRFSPAPAPFFDPSIVFYLTAPAGTAGAPALVLYSAAANQLYPALGIGIAYPQAQPAQSLSFGNGEQYGFVLTQESGSEADGSGQFTATSGQGGGTLSGLNDSSMNPFGASPLSFTGVFACPQGAPSCPDPFGRFSASTLTIDGSLSTEDYFLIDQDHGFLIETDTPDSSQASLGSFAERCDVTQAGNCEQAARKAFGKAGLRQHVRKGWRGSKAPLPRSN
jgi:hypothetical protein